MVILKILIGILLFGLIVLVHEFGHFIVARAFGVKVIEFSIGMGPRLFTIHGKQTDYSFKALPFGGSCMMKDELDVEDETHTVPDSDSFVVKPAWQRFLIIFAGPAFNFILAFICSLVLISQAGIDRPVITSVMDGYPAAEAGISAGDKIKSINGRKTFLFRDIKLYIALHTGEDLEVVYDHNGENRSTVIVPKYDKDNDSYLIGIRQESGYEKPRNVFEAVKFAFYEVRYNILTAIDSIKFLLIGKGKMTDMMGPVGIVDTVGDTIEASYEYGILSVILTLLDFVILFSSNVAVMNLLPIPALDGCRLLFALIEMIIGKPLNRKFESYINVIGLFILMGLMVWILINDVIRIATK